MAIERNWKTRLRYRSDELLSGGAGKQLLLLFVLTMLLVVFYVLVASLLHIGQAGDSLPERAWFYFGRLIDTGTMSSDTGWPRLLSIAATVSGVVVAGLLISSLAGNFQERLEDIRRTGSPVMEQGHYLILGWSEKIYSVIDQLAEANAASRTPIVAVVLAERPKVEMEATLRDKIAHGDRVKLVARSGSSVSLHDLSRVAFDSAQAIVVLLDETDAEHAERGDGRVIKTLMAIYNHPDWRDDRAKQDTVRVTAEVKLQASREIALIASDDRARVVLTNEIISKIILQTSRITGLSLVYDELLRFEGNEIHQTHVREAVGRAFGDLVLDFPNACLLGVASATGGHRLNPPNDHVVTEGDDLLLLAEDDDIPYRRHPGSQTPPSATARPEGRPVEQLLVLGWNDKVFPIIDEFDRYVGPGSTITLVSDVDVAERERLVSERCPSLTNVRVVHHAGSFTSRTLMDRLHPEKYPTVMVLGDATAGSAEAADTRAIIALLLLRDARRRAGVTAQEVCSEILDPRNRELAQTTEIRDIVISNEMVSMVLAQVTHDPRIHAVLEDLFAADGSEIYLKDLALYATADQPVTFEQLVLAARARGELAMGVQRQQQAAGPARRYGIVLNPKDRTVPFVPALGDRLVVLAEDDG